MAYLFSQYGSGLQLTAGPTVGSYMGTSGLNAFVDRLNSIAFSDNLITGSLISGTQTKIYGNYSSLTAGEGIDINGGSVISCESATTTNKGIVEIATNAEAAAYSSSSVALVPSNLPSSVVTSLIAGEGIDISNGSTIACEDSTAANKGIVIVSEGEGIDVSYSGGTATVAGEDASTTNKGIVELATTAEATSGLDTSRALTCEAFTNATGTISSSISGTNVSITMGDHIGSFSQMGVNVIYGTGSAPTAGSYSEGTLYIQYTE